MNDTKIFTHPSYAVITTSRCSGNRESLFGTSIETNHYVSLQIKPAELHRHLNNDWIHSKNIPIIEVNMTETQWAQVVSSVNNGDGCPCTITYKDGVRVEAPPKINKVAEFNNEFKDNLQKLSKDMQVFITDTVEILQTKKNLNKSDRDAIIKNMEHFVMNITSGVPFIVKQFSETMEKIVLDAKSQVNAHMLNSQLNRQIENSKDIDILLPSGDLTNTE